MSLAKKAPPKKPRRRRVTRGWVVRIYQETYDEFGEYYASLEQRGKRYRRGSEKYVDTVDPRKQGNAFARIVDRAADFGQEISGEGRDFSEMIEDLVLAGWLQARGIDRYGRAARR